MFLLEEPFLFQDVLLGAVREVASSLSGLIEATRNHCLDGVHPITKHVKIPSEVKNIYYVIN